MLSLHAALCFVTGKPFLGKYKTIQTKVIYYCLEDELADVKLRADYFLKGEKIPKDSLLLLNDAYSLSLDEEIEKIKKDISETGAKIIIIDTLRRSTSADENSSQEMAKIMNALRALIRELQVTIILVHHTGHIRGRGKGSLNDSSAWLRGSTELAGSYDTLIALTYVNKQTGAVNAIVFHRRRSGFALRYVTRRGSELDEILQDYPITGLEYESEDQNLKISRSSICSKKELGRLKVREQMLEICDFILIFGNVTKPQLASAFSFLELKGENLNRRINSLLQEGILDVSKEKGGQRKTADLFCLKCRDYRNKIEKLYPSALADSKRWAMG